MENLFKEAEVRPAWEIDPKYQEFYKFYHKPGTHKIIYKSYQRALKRTTHETIMAALRRQWKARSILERKKQFVPTKKDATTWLNNDCWTTQMEENLAAEVEQQLAHESRIAEERKSANTNPIAQDLAQAKRDDFQKAFEAYNRLPTQEKKIWHRKCAAKYGVATWENSIKLFWEDWKVKND